MACITLKSKIVHGRTSEISLLAYGSIHTLIQRPVTVLDGQLCMSAQKLVQDTKHKVFSDRLPMVRKQPDPVAVEDKGRRSHDAAIAMFRRWPARLAMASQSRGGVPNEVDAFGKRVWRVGLASSKLNNRSKATLGQ